MIPVRQHQMETSGNRMSESTWICQAGIKRKRMRFIINMMIFSRGRRRLAKKSKRTISNMTISGEVKIIWIVNENLIIYIIFFQYWGNCEHGDICRVRGIPGSSPQLSQRPGAVQAAGAVHCQQSSGRNYRGGGRLEFQQVQCGAFSHKVTTSFISELFPL